MLARELEEEEADAVRLDLEEALGALGRHVADDPFVTDAIRLFGFLESEHGFPAPTVETGGFSHMVAAETTSSPWRHRTNGASASRSGS